jgi:S-adenosylmethionine synthetase
MKQFVQLPRAGGSDRICDSVIDAIVAAYLERDPKSRLNLSAIGSHGMMMIGGTADSRADFDISHIVKEAYTRIGFDGEIEPFINIEGPSEETGRLHISGSDEPIIIRGYATSATREMLPRPIIYLHEILKRLEEAEKHGVGMQGLLPDGSVQIGMDGKTVTDVQVLVQHKAEIDLNHLRDFVTNEVILTVIRDLDGVRISVNPGGPFVNGGFDLRAGRSGQLKDRILYGDLLPPSSHAANGKDPLHPANSGAKKARAIAEELVRLKKAKAAFVTLTYHAGEAEPIYAIAKNEKGEDLSDFIDKTACRTDRIVAELGA